MRDCAAPDCAAESCGGENMRFPCLVKKEFCKTKIDVKIAREGLNKYGEPLEPVEWSGTCNLQEKAGTIVKDGKKFVKISAKVLIPGDICPELPIISGGSVAVNGVERSIAMGAKVRNPDDTVNYTEVMLE